MMPMKIQGTSVRVKVAKMFDELPNACQFGTGQDVLTQALSKEYGAERAWEIAFHLTDWTCDAKFLIAV